MVVRSHQSKKYGLGFDLMHDEKLIRVFSARDYEGHCNDGAVLLVRPIADDEEQSYERPSCMSVRAQVLGSYAKALGHRGSAVPSSNGTAWQRGSGLGHCKMQVPLASIVGTWHRHVEFVVCRTVTGLYNRDRPCQSYLPQMWGNDVYPCINAEGSDWKETCELVVLAWPELKQSSVSAEGRGSVALIWCQEKEESRQETTRIEGCGEGCEYFLEGEYHCFGFVGHEIGQKSIDGFLLAEMEFCLPLLANAIHRHRFDEIVSCQKWYLFQDFVHLLVVVGHHPPGFVMHFHIRGPFWGA